MILGVVAFAWTTLVPLKNLAPDLVWPLYPLGGAVLGAVLTHATRNAGRRTIGRVLLCLGMLALAGIVGFVLLYRGDEIYIGPVPIESVIALTFLPLPLWLLLSSRSTVPELRAFP